MQRAITLLIGPVLVLFSMLFILPITSTYANDLIRACVKPNGNLHLIGEDFHQQACRNREILVEWITGEGLDERVTTLESQIFALEGHIADLENQVAAFESRIMALEARIADLETAFRGVMCPEGQFLTGFDASGNLKCGALAGSPALQIWDSSDFPVASTGLNSPCNGAKFIKQSRFAPGLFVGVILCNPDRYKLLLASVREGPYFVIGDTGGMGEDHCELMGGMDTTAIGPVVAPASEEGIGFWRNSHGEPFQFGTLPADAVSTQWYECGISFSR
jgi:hypothetical protein